MAQDATGTPTSLGIPTYDVNVDAPTGLGFNAAMAEVDTLIKARVLDPSTQNDGEPLVWDTATLSWKPVHVKINDGTKFLRGDGTWAAAINDQVQVIASPTLTSSVSLSVPFTTEDFKTVSGMHSNTVNTSRLIAVNGGTYLTWVNVGWNNNTNGSRSVQFLKNGVGLQQGSAAPAGDSSVNTFQSATMAVVLAANDYLEVGVFQDSGGNLSANVRFGMLRIA